MQKKSALKISLFLILSVFLLSACGGKSLDVISAQDLVSNSANRMEKVSSFEFEILRDGAPAYLDISETLVLRKMTGVFAAPESATAEVKVILTETGVSVSIDIVSIGETQYETLPFASNWTELPPGQGFNPAELFDVEIGLRHILENDILEMKVLEASEIESLPGRNLYTISGILDGTNLSAMTYQLIDSDPINFKVWIDPDTFDLHQMEMIEHQGTDNERTWMINFWNFNNPITIEPPIQ